MSDVVEYVWEDKTKSHGPIFFDKFELIAHYLECPCLHTTCLCETQRHQRLIALPSRPHLATVPAHWDSLRWYFDEMSMLPLTFHRIESGTFYLEDPWELLNVPLKTILESTISP